MDVTHQGKTAMQGGAEALEDAAHKMKHGVDKAADNVADMATDAWIGARQAGREVKSFVYRRPVETALLSAAAACLVTGLAFWFTRPD
jgi:hypothetical protein